MIRFLLTAAALAFGFPPLVQLAFSKGWISSVPSFLYETTWLVATTTSILFIYLYRLKKGAFFVQFYLLSLVVKLIAFLAYNLILILRDRDHAAGNVVCFLVIYFLFTAIEIGFLYRKISSASKP